MEKRRSGSPPQSLHAWNFSTIQAASPTGESVSATPSVCGLVAWIERAYNLRRHTPMPSGGHFAALEEPDLLVEDIRAFFRPLRFGAAND